MILIPIKIFIREVCYTLFPILRWTYRVLGFRFQAPDFKLGKLKSTIQLKEFKAFLHRRGFERNHLAWVYDHEVLNVRKRLLNGRQYHIRVFKNGAVKGHYEYSPEHSPLKHYWCERIEARKNEFKNLLGGFLVFK